MVNYLHGFTITTSVSRMQVCICRTASKQFQCWKIGEALGRPFWMRMVRLSYHELPCIVSCERVLWTCMPELPSSLQRIRNSRGSSHGQRSTKQVHILYKRDDAQLGQCAFLVRYQRRFLQLTFPFPITHSTKSLDFSPANAQFVVFLHIHYIDMDYTKCTINLFL